MQPPKRLLQVADVVRRAVWRAVGPRTIGVRGIVVDAAGRVLLVRHTYGPELWHLPGGGVKRRESLVDGLRRELREEAGVIVEGTPSLAGVYSNLGEGKSDHIAVFEVVEWQRERSDSAEIDRCEFFDPAGLPRTVSPGTRRRIDEWTGTATHRPFIW